MNSTEKPRIGPLIEALHRRLGPVSGEMCLAIATRRVTASEVEAWVRELRDCADALDKRLNSK